MNGSGFRVRAFGAPRNDVVYIYMSLKIATWNINSVRLRIDLVAKFIKSARPDVLCLQETKCPDDAFPLKRFKRLGYEHVALNGDSIECVALLACFRYPGAASPTRKGTDPYAGWLSGVVQVLPQPCNIC